MKDRTLDTFPNGTLYLYYHELKIPNTDENRLDSGTMERLPSIYVSIIRAKVSGQRPTDIYLYHKYISVDVHNTTNMKLPVISD